MPITRMLANTIPVSAAAAPLRRAKSWLLMSVPDSKPTSHPRTVVWILMPDLFRESFKKLLRRVERMAGMAERRICMKL